MGQAIATFSTETLNIQTLRLEPMEVEYTKEPLERVEMATERTEPRNHLNH